LNDVSRIESRRRRAIEVLRDRAKSDDITNAILTEATRLEHAAPLRTVEAADFDNLFTARLAKYDDDAKVVQREVEDQEALESKIREANSSFLAARKAERSEGLKEREEALQTLENAYTKYKEVIGNLESGRMFYNNLATLVARFRDEVKQFVHNRRLQADQIEMYVLSSPFLIQFINACSLRLTILELRGENSDIESAMSSLRLSNAAQQSLPSRQSLLSQTQPSQQAQPASIQTLQQPSNTTTRQTPLPAPQAQRPVPVPTVNPGVWTPDQGIRFGPR